MARPTLLKHRKFRRLVYLLGMPEAHVLGHLEYLWQGAWDAGEQAVGDRIDLELAAGWSGERGVFAAAAIDAGFFDEVDGLVTIHDMWDHAPDYVERRAKKEAERRIRGQSLSEIRAEAGRLGALKRWQQDGKVMANVDRLPSLDSNLPFFDGKRMANVATPAPAPAPERGREELREDPKCAGAPGLFAEGELPRKEPKRRNGKEPVKAKGTPKAELYAAFAELWEVYPPENRGEFLSTRGIYAHALQGKREDIPPATPEEILEGTKPWVAHWTDASTPAEFIPSLRSFILKRQWTQKPIRRGSMATEVVGMDRSTKEKKQDWLASDRRTS